MPQPIIVGLGKPTKGNPRKLDNELRKLIYGNKIRVVVKFSNYSVPVDVYGSAGNMYGIGVIPCEQYECTDYTIRMRSIKLARKFLKKYGKKTNETMDRLAKKYGRTDEQIWDRVDELEEIRERRLF